MESCEDEIDCVKEQDYPQQGTKAVTIVTAFCYNKQVKALNKRAIYKLNHKTQ